MMFSCLMSSCLLLVPCPVSRAPCLQSGYKVADFFALCKEVLEGGEVFGSQRFFVDMMLATSEYSSFFMLMKAEVKLNQRAPAGEPSDHK
jgi:hypothetical protein